MGLLDGYFTPETLLGLVSGDYFRNTVHRPAPSSAIGDTLEMVGDIAAMGAAGAMGMMTGSDLSEQFEPDLVKLGHLVKYINPVASIEGIDPTKLLAVTKMVMKTPEKIPNYMQSGDSLMIQVLSTIINSLLKLQGNESGNSTYGIYDPRKLDVGHKDAEQILKDTAEFKTEATDIKIKYCTYASPYFSEKTNIVSSLDAVKKISEELSVDIGYGNLAGYEPGSNHNWRIQLFPYVPGDNDLHLDKRKLNSNHYKDKTFTPALPYYYIPTVFNQGYNHRDSQLGTLEEKKKSEESNKFISAGYSAFSFGVDTPAVSYNLDLGGLRSRAVPLFGDSQMSIPQGIAYDPTINIGVVDNVDGTFRAWYHKYLNSIYDLTHAAMPRYDLAALVVRLLVMKPNYAPKYEFRFICVPNNYTAELQGSAEADEDTVMMNLSIVGMMRPTINGNGSALYGVESDDKDSISWTDVMLLPQTKE